MRVLCRFAETLFFPVCRMYDDYDDAEPIYVQPYWNGAVWTSRLLFPVVALKLLRTGLY